MWRRDTDLTVLGQTSPMESIRRHNKRQIHTHTNTHLVVEDDKCLLGTRKEKSGWIWAKKAAPAVPTLIHQSTPWEQRGLKEIHLTQPTTHMYTLRTRGLHSKGSKSNHGCDIVL